MLLFSNSYVFRYQLRWSWSHRDATHTSIWPQFLITITYYKMSIQPAVVWCTCDQGKGENSSLYPVILIFGNFLSLLSRYHHRSVPPHLCIFIVFIRLLYNSARWTVMEIVSLCLVDRLRNFEDDPSTVKSVIEYHEIQLAVRCPITIWRCDLFSLIPQITVASTCLLFSEPCFCLCSD